MPEPFTTLGLAKTTFDTIKEAMDFARKTKNADLAMKLVDAYRDMLGMMEANSQLRSEISKLKDQGELERSLKFDRTQGSYTLLRDGKEEGPFCSTCWDIDRRLVRKTFGTAGYYFCDWCDYKRPRR
ncbi:MAG TPA: hypothetical protein VK763_15240 [Terriglobales bacterium]|jgi:hypothetical protein|nr:hypothetical protein [Terriglobales bacterium]